MTVSSINNTPFVRVRPPASAPAIAAPAAAPNNSRQDLLRARDELLQAWDALNRLAEMLDVRTRFQLNLTDARSDPALNLDLSTTAATLESNGEINASPMSFTPFGPDWAAGSTALLTVGGEYDGTHGDGNLTFEVRRPGVRGINDLRIGVYDPQGNRIRNFNVRANHDLDRQYDLQNGLHVTVGNGLLLSRDTATIQVSTTTGEVFDPTLPFNGVRNDNPNFQYYDAPNTLADIVDGSFLLNGTAIAVNAADNLTTVVDRINASAAGVTATYNAATERLEFLQNTAGAAPTIDIQGDTSNLVAALKLDSAVVVPGTDPETARALQDVGTFGAVQSGSVRINGTDIAVDTTTDSLDDVLARINGSGAGVNAVFDAASQQVVIENSGGTGVLEIDGNGTGLFAALNLPEGRLDPQAAGGGLSRRRSYAVADEIERAFQGLSRVFQDGTFRDGADHTGLFQNLLSNAVGDFFGDRGSAPDEISGIRFDFTSSGRQRGRFAGLDRRDFTTDLQQRGAALKRLLVGGRNEQGLIQALTEATAAALGNVSTALGRRSPIVDTFA